MSSSRNEQPTRAPREGRTAVAGGPASSPKSEAWRLLEGGSPSSAGGSMLPAGSPVSGRSLKASVAAVKGSASGGYRLPAAGLALVAVIGAGVMIAKGKAGQPADHADGDKSGAAATTALVDGAGKGRSAPVDLTGKPLPLTPTGSEPGSPAPAPASQSTNPRPVATAPTAPADIPPGLVAPIAGASDDGEATPANAAPLANFGPAAGPASAPVIRSAPAASPAPVSIPAVAPAATETAPAPTAPVAADPTTAVTGPAQVPAFLAAASAPTKPAVNPADARLFGTDVLPFLKQHCIRCHSNAKKTAGINLELFPDAASVSKDAKSRKVWATVLANVRTGVMPPPEVARPAPQAVEKFVVWSEAVLSTVDCKIGQTNPGRVTMRRLNKAEYNNTIRDLTGVDFRPGDDFPADDVGYGFDNIGDVLSVSPLLLEKYLAAAERIVEKAVVLAEPPKPQKRRVRGPQLRSSPRTSGGRFGNNGWIISSAGQAVGNQFLDAGEYVVRVRLFQQAAGDEPAKIAVRLGDKEIKRFDVPSTDERRPTTVEVKWTVAEAHNARLAVEFLNDHYDAATKKDRNVVVLDFELDGPHNAPPPPVPEATRKIMAHKAGAAPREAVREIVTRFAAKAFRRPVTAAEIERFLRLSDAAAKEGDPLEGQVRYALQGVLVSPHFLYRVEVEPAGLKPGESRPVTEFELATRLSYFLWCSTPDDALLDLAGKGQLRKNLDAQIARMLADPKAYALVDNFGSQWLQTRNLATFAPDKRRFPAFDEELRGAMQRETELFFDHIVRGNRSILEFLESDWTFLNERLARHYGINTVKGPDFRKVQLPDASRGGLLTQGSILAITSNPTRTSPVKRGKWILEQILGTPPPPAPPDVPELEAQKGKLTGTLRQQMEQHRANPACASCHNRMDALGFAFENFDAIGAFRAKDGKDNIDPSGVLPDGSKFTGPADLKKILRGRTELFGRCFTEKLLTFALGRGLEPYDKCHVDKVMAAGAKDGWKFNSLVAAVVGSEPFQMRRTGAGAGSGGEP